MTQAATQRVATGRCAQSMSRFFPTMRRIKHRQAYLGVFHHTLNAVKVREVTNRFIRIVQHPLDRLQKENTTSRQML